MTGSPDQTETKTSASDEHPHTAAFKQVIQECLDMHERKGADYGSDKSPFDNLLTAESFGLDPIFGIALRMNDKMTRIKNFYKKGQLVNDSVEDDFIDIAVYCLIALALKRCGK
jgi:hypothetical protein